MVRVLMLVPLLLVAPMSRGDDPNNRGLTPPARPDQAAPAPPPAGFHQVKLNGHAFTLPDGFTIELAAGPDLAARPIVAAFDEKGRLYVCDSSGSNANVNEQVKTKPHRIMRLEDTDGDGRFDKSTVYVKNVMFPEGAMWLDGSLYVGAPPQILKFTDTNDDGTADKEEVWFDGKTLTGCANDLHGPYAGPDGMVYWCKGAFAKQEYVLPNGKKLGTRAAHIFRAKPDGTGIEPVMTGGMDNPVDVVFTPGGERIFTTTFFQHPGNGQRDGLVHAVYGGVYGKDHDPVYEHPWTAPTLMPVLTHMGPAAPCGLHRYESDQFGPDYTDNLFACQFNLRKVSRHILVPSGATFVTKDSDFVVSDNLDFHPTDVIEDADGSLLIVDTGGWYKLCCPTSQLVKPDVTGAIYRVKKVGRHGVDDPWGLRVHWGEINDLEDLNALGRTRPAVLRRAIEVLAGRPGDPARFIPYNRTIGDLNGDPSWRAPAMRVLARIDTPPARAAVRDRLVDADPAVRLTAVHAVALRRDREAVAGLRPLLAHPDRHTRRAAAEALGRIGDKAVVPDLLKALADESNDRVLDHSLTYALIEIGDPKGTADGLAHAPTRVRRAALAALDAMPDGKLGAKAVLAELDGTDPALRETAWWVAGRHPDWGGKLAGYFAGQLQQADALTPERRDELVARLAKFGTNPAVQKVMGEALEAAKSADAARPVLRAMARSGAKKLPEAWVSGLREIMIAVPDGSVDPLQVLRACPPTAEQYRAVRSNFDRLAGVWDGPPTMIARARLLVDGLAPPGPRSDAEVDRLVGYVGPDSPEWVRDDGAVRAAAFDILARAALTPDQLVRVAAALKAAGPLDRPKLLPVFERSADEKAGLALVAALSDPAVRGSIRAEQVKPILDKYPPAVNAEAEKLYALLAEARKDETAKLDRLLRELPAGDIRRGQVVFNGAKAQCIACHQMGYVGGKVGPDLTRVGGTRSDRDLLEAIVFPSASFVRSYEPVRVVTADGRALSGVLTKDAPDEIVLAVAADKEERVARADVESISPGTVSVMPAGLDQQLTPQDLADLVAFLKASR
ncbi:MAG: HEAT repeat domain-containing protein [Gemmataceae bacterium]|nr:HEAT repeat domain-containing protein [Gemmataceae bacterium]